MNPEPPKHTPEPWKIVEGPHDEIITSEAGTPIAQCFDNPDSGLELIDDEQSDNNLKRIVACVNACANIQDPSAALAQGRAALEACVIEFDCPARNTTRGNPHGAAVIVSTETRERTRAALALLPAPTKEGP